MATLLAVLGVVPGAMTLAGKLADIYTAWKASKNTPDEIASAEAAQEVAEEEKTKQDVQNAYKGKPDAFNSSVGK